MQAQQERDQMTRSRKMIGWCVIKEEEGVGRGTALLVYRSHVMRPCYVTCPYWVQHTCESFWEEQVSHHSACKSVSLSTHAITHFLWWMGVFVQLLRWSQAWKEGQYWQFPYSFTHTFTGVWKIYWEVLKCDKTKVFRYIILWSKKMLMFKKGLKCRSVVIVIQNSIEVGHKDFCSSSWREDECVKFDPVPETFHWFTNSRLSLGEGESTKALILLHLEPVSVTNLKTDGDGRNRCIS